MPEQNKNLFNRIIEVENTSNVQIFFLSVEIWEPTKQNVIAGTFTGSTILTLEPSTEHKCVPLYNWSAWQQVCSLGQDLVCIESNPITGKKYKN